MPMSQALSLRGVDGMNRKLMKELPLHVMLLPSAVLLLIYNYLPMAGLVMAFQRYIPSLGFFKSEWVGWKNFKYIFTTPGFDQALINTVFIAVMKIVSGMIVPVAFALLLNEVGKSLIKRTFQTVVYLPYFISWVLMSGIIIDIFSPNNGIINQFLGLFGIQPIYFVGDNNWFPYVLVITHIWKEFGWGTIIFMAALTGIDPSLYEASHIDGAGHWKQSLYITLPGIMPTFVLIASLSLGNILNAGFDQVFNLLSPVTIQSGDIIDTLVYRLGIQEGQYSVATAAGLFKSVISFIMISLSYKLAYRYTGYRIF